MDKEFAQNAIRYFYLSVIVYGWMQCSNFLVKFHNIFAEEFYTVMICVFVCALLFLTRWVFVGFYLNSCAQGG